MPSFRRSVKRSRFRKLFLESLAPRHLLASLLGPVDVSGDGYLSGIDALQVVNALNEKAPYNKRFDVNRDRLISPLDVLLVVNAVNARGSAPAEGAPPNLPPVANNDVAPLSQVPRVTDASFQSLTGGVLKNGAGTTIGTTTNLTAANTVPGAFGNSLVFNAAGQRATIAPTPGLSALGVNNADFSLTFWYRLDETANGVYRVVLFKGNTELERGPSIWMLPDTNQLHVRLSTTASFNDGFDSIASLTVGQWTQIAITKQGNIWSLYFNGLLDRQQVLGGASLGNNGPIYLGSTPWQVGAKSAIDELEVFGKALSKPEIDLLYVQPQLNYLFATGDVSLNDTDPELDDLTFALVSQSANSAVALQADGKFNYATPAVPAGGLLFTYKAVDEASNESQGNVTSTPASNSPPDAVDDIFALPNVTRTIDSSFQTLIGGAITNNAGTAIGSSLNLTAANLVAGPFGNALQFNQADQRAIIAPTAELSAMGVNNADFSLSFRYRLDETANGLYRVVMFKGGVDTQRGPGIWMRPDNNKLHVQLSTTANFNEGFNSVAALTVGQWTQVTVVKQGSLWKLYLNGVLDNQVLLAGTTTGNTGPLYLGSTPWQAGAKGTIDELEIFNKALSKPEIALLQTLPNQPYQFVQGDVSLNDSDPNGDPLTFALVSSAPGGFVDFSADGKFAYATLPVAGGNLLLTYKAIDTALLEDLATVFKGSSNLPPNAVNDSVQLSVVPRVTSTRFQSIAGGRIEDTQGVAIGTTVNLSAANIVAGTVGNALRFNQAGQRAVIAPTPALNQLGTNNADYSLTFQYRLEEAFDTQYRVVLFKGNTDLERGPGVWMRPDSNQLHVQVSTTLNFNEGFNSVAALTVGQWTQVTITKQGSLWSLYLNGVLDNQLTLTAPTVGNDGPLYVGSTPWQAGAMATIDELEVFAKALTPTEIALLQVQPNLPYQFAQGDVSLNDNDPNGDPLTFALVSTAAGSFTNLSTSGQFNFATLASATPSPLFTYKAIDAGLLEDAAVVTSSSELRGLVGEYYDNADLTNRLLVRNDPNIDFNWGLGSPAATLGVDTFSVRWTGQIQPQFSETYTFQTFTDDGVRLWINNQLIIDHWISPGLATHTGAITLVAGQKVALRMEYYENNGAARAQLSWSSPSQPLQIVPQEQLFQAAGNVSVGGSVISVNEPAGFATVNILRQLGADGTITVDYRTVATTAAPGVDYTEVAGTLTFLTGETSKQVLVPIFNDLLPEANETFTFTIDNVGGGASLLVPRTATITIIDDDTPLPNYDDFFGASGLTLNGNAAIVAGKLRVTPNLQNQKGTVFFSTPIAVNDTTSFQTRFDFQLTGGLEGADGFTFLLQNSALGAAAIGDGLGYDGVLNSLAVEFDTFQNIGEINGNHIAIVQNGTVVNPLSVHAVPFDMNDGSVRSVWIDYNGSSNQLAVYVAETNVKPEQPLTLISIDLGSLVGPQLYAGFASATGGSSNNHDILNWHYATTIPDIPNPPGPVPLDVTVVSGLAGPTAIEWADNNRNLLIAQKDGEVRVMRDGVLLGAPFIDLRDQVNQFSDRGLLGLTVHPNFAVTPYVYLLYTYDPPETAANTGLAGPDGGGNRTGRLIRVTADAATGYTTIVPGSEVVLLGTNGVWANFNGFVDSTVDFSQPPAGILPDGSNLRDFIAVDSTTHAPGSVVFGPDGALYVSVGDGASYNQVDPRAIRVQDIDNLSGKILRIDPITGAGLTSNPFYNGDAAANRSKVYQLGLRNPFRMDIDPLTGRIFVGDVGWSTWEEINSAGPGANFGWPYYEGGNGVSSQQTGGYQNLPQAQAFYASGAPVAASVVALNHAADGINAIIMGAVYRGGLYPAEYQGDVFFSDLGQGIVRHISFDAAGNATAVELFTTGANLVVQIKQAPDGSLYFVDLDDGRIGQWLFL